MSENQPPPMSLRLPPDLREWYEQHAEALGVRPHRALILALEHYAVATGSPPERLRHQHRNEQEKTA